MLDILPVIVLPLASVTTTVSIVVGTVAVTGLPLASKVHLFLVNGQLKYLIHPIKEKNLYYNMALYTFLNLSKDLN